MPFKTPLEAAIAHLIAQGVIKGNADVARDLKMKSRSTVSSYANGKLPISFKFQTLFENKYGIKLEHFEQAAAKENTKPDEKRLDVPVTKDNTALILNLLQQQAVQLQGMNRKLNEIEQQQIVTAAIQTSYQEYLVSVLDTGSDPESKVVEMQRKAFEKLTRIQTTGMPTAVNSSHR